MRIGIRPGLAITVVLAACGGPDRSAGPAPSPPDTTVAAKTPAAADTAGAWTTGVVSREGETGPAGQATLVSVRAVRHPGFDRVVWAFEGAALPDLRVGYVDEPVRECGSGRAVPLPGAGRLEVRMAGARAHTDAGRPTVGERRSAPGVPAVAEIARTCDFEGALVFVLAVRSPAPVRVATLLDPARLVVDVRHPGR